MTSELTFFNLKGKTALITGAAGLLGCEHACALIEIGAHVILTDVRENELKNVKATILQEFPNASIDLSLMDVTNEKSVREVLNEYKAKNIVIDILINNAAIDAKVNPDEGITNTSRLEVFDLKEWDKQLSVGLTGAFICCKIFGFAMAQNGGGVILNVASDLSVIAPDQRLYSNTNTEERCRVAKPVTYSVVKSGLIGLTKYLSTYWPEKSVRCNSISPGGVYDSQGQDFIEKVQELIPLKRMANKSEYRGSIQYLCSDASSYMTGQNIVVDGGRSVW